MRTYHNLILVEHTEDGDRVVELTTNVRMEDGLRQTVIRRRPAGSFSPSRYVLVRINHSDVTITRHQSRPAIPADKGFVWMLYGYDGRHGHVPEFIHIDRQIGLDQPRPHQPVVFIGITGEHVSTRLFKRLESVGDRLLHADGHDIGLWLQSGEEHRYGDLRLIGMITREDIMVKGAKSLLIRSKSNLRMPQTDDVEDEPSASGSDDPMLDELSRYNTYADIPDSLLAKFVSRPGIAVTAAELERAVRTEFGTDKVPVNEFLKWFYEVCIETDDPFTDTLHNIIRKHGRKALVKSVPADDIQKVLDAAEVDRSLLEKETGPIGDLTLSDFGWRLAEFIGS